jgi:hypothetical protein
MDSTNFRRVSHLTAEKNNLAFQQSVKQALKRLAKNKEEFCWCWITLKYRSTVTSVSGISENI